MHGTMNELLMTHLLFNKKMGKHIVNLLISNLSMGRREQQSRVVYPICVAVELVTESP